MGGGASGPSGLAARGHNIWPTGRRLLDIREVGGCPTDGAHVRGQFPQGLQEGVPGTAGAARGLPLHPHSHLGPVQADGHEGAPPGTGLPGQEAPEGGGYTLTGLFHSTGLRGEISK